MRTGAARLVAVGAGLVAAAMATPFVYLAIRAAAADDPVSLAMSARVGGLVWNTLRLAVAVTAGSVSIGVGCAWLLERSDLPARRWLGVAAALPLAVPSYIAALALLSAFGPGGDVVAVPGLTGFWGASVVLILSTYPYVLLVSRAAFSSSLPALDDAATTLGLHRFRRFRRAQFPQLRAAVSASALLCALYVVSDFGAVTTLRYPTLTRGIFLEYRSSFDRSAAAVMSLVLVLFTITLIVAERVARGPIAPPRHSSSGRHRVVVLGRWRTPATMAVALPALLGAGLPAAIAIGWLQGGSRQSAGRGVLAAAAATSAGLSLAAALAAVVLCLPVAILAARRSNWVVRVIESGALAGYALPGLVVALSLVFLATRSAPFAYQTLGLVVAAYVVRFMPEALASARPSLASVDTFLTDASRTLGGSRWATALRVTWPIVRGGLFAGGALVFLTAMKELPATLLLRPAGVDTLAIRVWTGASEGFYAQAAPAALLLLAVSALALLPAWRAGSNSWRRVHDG
ncbi:MAG TPA: iron ABC transporter permease [Acidimicrobiales bacterium]|nr:iron ABC transporter permease [Acidimicrobiales bacterium]